MIRYYHLLKLEYIIDRGLKITCQPLHAPQHQWPLPIVHELLLVLVDGWMIEHDTILSWNLI